MPKFNRSTAENKLLDVRDEFIQDIRLVKKKSDSKSQRNKEILKNKIKILDCFILILASERICLKPNLSEATYDKATRYKNLAEKLGREIPATKELQKFTKKVINLIEEETKC